MKKTDKPRGPGGSPSERARRTTADEDLEKMIADMRNQSDNMREQMMQIEDERRAELALYDGRMQRARQECHEFDQQYNHVLDCWRRAEERSRTFEMEMRSEINLFHEVRGYLGEMQQQLAQVSQEDYGAGLRTKELETIITREREETQNMMSVISQETYQECTELRERGDKIFVEASEAIAQKDIQQYQEREIITDEAMVLKRQNDTLLNELGQWQNDATQAIQFARAEQRSLNDNRARMTEEENSIRNLSGELNMAQTYFNLEKPRADQLQENMEEDRSRYDRRLSLVMANPAVRNQGTNNVDMASKIEIQNLRQELAAAQNSIVVSNQPPNIANTHEEEQLVARLKTLEDENQEMKSNGAFDFWRKKWSEDRDERLEFERKYREARDEARAEKEMFAKEEERSRRKGEDVDRLRGERDEWREYYDNLFEGWAEGGEEEVHDAEEIHEARSTISEAAVSEIDHGSSSRISRKEADKVIVPNWPKIHELEFWKSQVTANIVAACGDLDHEAWISWVAPAFRMSPEIDGKLAKSGDSRFNSIDVKLASALMTMLQNGGEQAREVLNEARLKMAKGCRGDNPTILKGRQLLAMVVDSFRSASNTDLVFTIKHLYDLRYPGDNELVMFKSQWNEVLECMRPGDVPNKVALRDILYDKVKGSKLMAFDLHYYEVKEDHHADKTYDYLLKMISKHIRSSVRRRIGKPKLRV